MPIFIQIDIWVVGIYGKKNINEREYNIASFQVNLIHFKTQNSNLINGHNELNLNLFEHNGLN